VGGTISIGGGVKPVQGGIALDVATSSLSDESGNLGHLNSTTLAVGPWIRWTMVRALDDRVEMIGAIDLQYVHVSGSITPDTGLAPVSGSASGVGARIGPGLRFWATPWLALSYLTQLSFTDLTGPLFALSPGSTIGPASYNFEATDLHFVGRFAVLAIFQ
jgi:hypothetical protein